jgi:hypothetical protein
LIMEGPGGCEDGSSGNLVMASLVGAGRLEVTRLLALVADTLVRGFRGAVARQMTDFTT